MDDTKKCTKCGRELPLDQFSRRKRRDGTLTPRPECKGCHNLGSSLWRKNNPEKCREQSSRWARNNPEKVKAMGARQRREHPEKRREQVARWRRANPEKEKAVKRKWCQDNLGRVRLSANKRGMERRVSDPSFKLAGNIRNAIGVALKNNARTGHTIELLGCSIEYFRDYLEALFQPGMTWNNWSRTGWHIDHIIPLSYFDMADPEQQKRAWHYTNLQPLWAVDNLRKSNKIEERQLVLL